MKKIAQCLWVLAAGALLSATSYAQVPSYSTGFDDAASLLDWRGGVAVVIQWNDPACTSYNSQYDYDFANTGTTQVAGLETSDSTGSSVLNTYSDYDNAGFQSSGCVTPNIFREYTIQAGDEGDYTFSFTNEFPNNPVNTAVSAQAFIKVLDPLNGFQDTRSGALVIDTTGSEGAKSIDVTIAAADVGMILQYGFSNNSANYQETGMYYDDVAFAAASTGGGGGSGGGGAGTPAQIPTMPLWGLIGLAGLLGLMGYRRKK